MQGAGSVGGLVGGRLVAAGHDVTFVSGNKEITKVLNSQGITLRHNDAETSVQAKAFTYVADIPASEHYDVICLAMMAQHAVQSMRDSLPRLKESACVVTFQNGIVIDAIGEVCGLNKLVPSTLAFGMTMEAHGEYRLTTDGAIILGELDGTVGARVNELGELFSDVIKTKVSPNIMGVLWGKLLWNASVSAICAITGRKLGDICGDTQTQGLIIQGYREAVETARALGITLEKVVVDFNKMYVPEGSSDATARELLVSLTQRYAEVVPSTSQSLQKGKLTEIDYLNGYVAVKAAGLEHPAPMHELLTKLVREVEQGHRKIDRRNVEALLVR